jgi:methionyl-tRNA formyltransferase
MKIVFFGSPDTALPSLRALIEAGHDIPLVVTQPDKPAGRGNKLRPPAVKAFAESAGFPVFQTRRIRKDPQAYPLLRSADPDLNVVVAFGQIIPSSLFNLPRLKSVNVHFSLLPSYRGAAPVQGAVINGERTTGITIFVLNEKMDEGDILSREEVAIHPHETAVHLEERLAGIGADLLVRTVANIQALPRQPQDHSLATHAPLIKKEDGRVDWTKSAGLVGRMIRAFMPWPSVFTFLGERRLKLLEVFPLDESLTRPSAGEILSVDPEGIRVCCGDGSVLRIARLQPENRGPMSARDFALGARLRPGDRFS